MHTVEASPGRRPICLSVMPDCEIRVDGARLELLPASARLLGFLCLQGGSAVRRGVASRTLWPEATDAKAGASLRSTIWRTARRAGPTLVCASASHVWLEPSIWVDLLAATARARALLDLEPVGSPAVDLDEDLRLLSNDVLVGWYEDWALHEQERFRQLRLHALDRLGIMLICAGRPGDAVLVGQVAVAAEPLRETAQTLLVRAHVAEGNAGEGLRQFRAYADLLAAELGIRPSRAMLRHVDDALAQRRLPGWSAHAEPAVGRAVERAAQLEAPRVSI